MIKILGTVFVMGACVIAVLFILERFENPVSEFATYAEMEASGLIEAGWIPQVIPKSAFEISETHNLDTGTVRISFRFRPGDVDIVEKECRLTSTPNMDPVFTCPEGTLTVTEEGQGYFTSD